MSGSKDERSISTTSSYFALGSAFSGFQTPSLPCILRYFFVCASLGKIEVSAPSSAPILVIVARSVTIRVLTPSPRIQKFSQHHPLLLTFSITLILYLLQLPTVVMRRTVLPILPLALLYKMARQP